MFLIQPCKAFAPPSIGNFAVGFDVLGVALESVTGEIWGDIVEILPDSHDSFSIVGAYASELCGDAADNLVMLARKLFEDSLLEIGRKPETMAITLRKVLPICSGLGSSASSIVAALVALNHAYNSPFSTVKLLQLAGQAEGSVSGSIHLDNVAPSLLGGAQVCVNRSESMPIALPFSLPDSWLLVVVHPELQVSTAMAREVLPSQIPLHTGVSYWANLAAFLTALHQGNTDLAKELLRDSLIEPYRAPLVKGFSEVRSAALGAGAFACSLSGSGPSVFAVADSAEIAEQISAMMQVAWQNMEIHSVGCVCRANGRGAKLVEVP